MLRKKPEGVGSGGRVKSYAPLRELGRGGFLNVSFHFCTPVIYDQLEIETTNEWKSITFRKWNLSPRIWIRIFLRELFQIQDMVQTTGFSHHFPFVQKFIFSDSIFWDVLLYLMSIFIPLPQLSAVVLSSKLSVMCTLNYFFPFLSGLRAIEERIIHLSYRTT